MKKKTTGRTRKEECPDCSAFERCDYHEGKRHGQEQERERVETLLNDISYKKQTHRYCSNDYCSVAITSMEECGECGTDTERDTMLVMKESEVRRRLNHDHDGDDDS